MSKVLDPTVTMQALQAFGLVVGGRETMRKTCEDCDKTFIRSDLTADVCPYCLSGLETDVR